MARKFYTFLNIFGLATGITCAFLLIIYITDELSFDKFHEDYEQIYRVNLMGAMAGQEFKVSNTSYPVGDAMVEEFPEVTDAHRLRVWRGTPVSFEDKLFSEDYVLPVDSNFFSFFSFELEEGNVSTVLTGPGKAVITREAAHKYFGDDNAIGKTIKVGTNRREFEVTGVAANPPHNSHFHFSVLISMESDDSFNREAWTNNTLLTYVKLTEGADWMATEEKMTDLVEKYIGPEIEKFTGATLAQFRENGGAYGYFLRPIADIHLMSDLDEEIEPSGNKSYIIILGAIALFILLVACINYMNLSTARSEDRSKEVGIRKTLGAFRSGLVRQFLFESFTIAIISSILAMALLALVLPAFNQFTQKAFTLGSIFTPTFLLLILGIILVIGLGAGSYPAFYLTSFQPVSVLKGKGSSRGNLTIRRSLVVFQFSISIVLIVSTLILYKQLNYLQIHNLGFEKENVMVVNSMWSLEDKCKAFKEQLLTLPGVKSASISSDVPPYIRNSNGFQVEGATQQDYILAVYTTDEDHLKTLNLEMAEGRYFSREFATDTAAILVNESAVKSFGWEEPLGMVIYSFHGSDRQPMSVVGVVKDFNFETLKSDIRPMCILLAESGNKLSVRLGPGNLMEQINTIQSIWKDYAPGIPFDYSFIDENFDSLFKTEQRMGELAFLFTVLAIFIAALGLFGLATFMAEQRTKEIGIRKVMGATVFDVAFLMSKEFTRLVIISFVISIPIAYFLMSNWLESFAYRINPGAVNFLLAGFAALMIAWITVSYQSIRTALRNPVDSLRSE